MPAPRDLSCATTKFFQYIKNNSCFFVVVVFVLLSKKQQKIKIKILKKSLFYKKNIFIYKSIIKKYSPTPFNFTLEIMMEHIKNKNKKEKKHTGK